MNKIFETKDNIKYISKYKRKKLMKNRNKNNYNNNKTELKDIESIGKFGHWYFLNFLSHESLHYLLCSCKNAIWYLGKLFGSWDMGQNAFS